MLDLVPRAAAALARPAGRDAAEDEARRRGHGYIGTEHLPLALLHAEPVAGALAALGSSAGDRGDGIPRRLGDEDRHHPAYAPAARSRHGRSRCARDGDAALGAAELFADGIRADGPGGQWAYSNLGLVALAALAADVLGAPIGECLRTWVLDPLGLAESASLPRRPGDARKPGKAKFDWPGRADRSS